MLSFKELKIIRDMQADIDALRVRIEALEARRGPGRPPKSAPRPINADTQEEARN